MDVQVVFKASNALVLPFWFLMIACPSRALTERVVGSLWIVVPAATLYTALMLPELGTWLPAFARPDLAQLASLLGTAGGTTRAYSYFLPSDLFIGRWVYLDARARRASPWIVSPLLFVILLLGPLGWLPYLGLRAVARGGLLGEPPERRS